VIRIFTKYISAKYLDCGNRRLLSRQDKLFPFKTNSYIYEIYFAEILGLN